MSPDQSENSPTPNFEAMQRAILTIDGDTLFIGGEKMSADMRSALRDEARYIQGSRLWELFNNAIINEAATTALLQSTDFDQVRFAKALYHWAHFFRNTLYTCIKEETQPS